MKLSTGLGDKLSSVEGGTMEFTNETKMSSSSQTKNWTAEKITKALKIILYLELIFFIGWFGCLTVSYHIAAHNYYSTESVTTISTPEIRSNEFPPIDVENPTNNETNPTINRGKRSIDENKREKCETNVTEIHGRTEEFINLLAPGEASEPNVAKLRDLCRRRLIDLTGRVAMMKLISWSDPNVPSDEEWTEIAQEVKERITSKPGDDKHGQETGTTDPVTTEMKNNLRSIIEDTIRNRQNCEGVVTFEHPLSRLTIALLLNVREECGGMIATMRKEIQPLLNKIIPGDSGDKIVSELRMEVENVALTLAANVKIEHDSGSNVTAMLDQVAKWTDDDLKNFLIKLKQDIAKRTDAEHRERIEQTADPSTEIVEEIRQRMNAYLWNFRDCTNLDQFIDLFKNFNERRGKRLKRQSGIGFRTDGDGGLADIFRTRYFPRNKF